MKAESNIKPAAAFELNPLLNGMTEVIFYENVEQIESERFSYDLYSVTIPSRDTLATDVEVSFKKWLAFAKAQEEQTKPLTPAEQIAALVAENEQLRAENELTANALDELICSIYGGDA